MHLNVFHLRVSRERSMISSPGRWCSATVGGEYENSIHGRYQTRAITVALLGGLCVFLVPQAYAQGPGEHSMVTPDQLQWKDAAGLPPGTQLTVIEGPMNEAVPFTVRIKFPAGTTVPAHWHPAIEHVTVMSGTLNMGVGDKLDESKAMRLPAGSISIMQPKTTHFGFFNEETIVQIHGVGPWAINYVNPADDPRKKTN